MTASRASSGDHHGDDADRQEQQLDQFDDAAADEVLDGAHIFDAAGDQLAGLGVIMKGERQVWMRSYMALRRSYPMWAAVRSER